MCAVSMIGDQFTQRFGQGAGALGYQPPVSREEFESLKREVEFMKDLLIRAKRYDEETGQKDCEMEDKIALLKKVAEAVGVDLAGIFEGKK